MPPVSLEILKDLGNSLLDFAFPNYCYLCRKSLSGSNKFFCPACVENLPQPVNPFCSICKNPYSQFSSDHGCQAGSEGVFSLWNYSESVEILIHKFKYASKTGLGKRLGELLAELLRKTPLVNELQIIIPVPLHKSRKRERGFNQAEILAEELGRQLNLPVETNSLSRIKNTADQTRLSAEERKLNVKDAFRIARQINLTDKSTLLVDDVITTGATLNECAQVLKKQGAKRVYACTLAVASFSSNS